MYLFHIAIFPDFLKLRSNRNEWLLLEKLSTVLSKKKSLHSLIYTLKRNVIKICACKIMCF